MRNLIATRPLTYATRRLRAGDEFVARTDRDAQVLVGIRKARYAPDVPVEDASLPSLRAEYEELVGKRPFMGWNAEQLNEKIAAARAED